MGKLRSNGTHVWAYVVAIALAGALLRLLAAQGGLWLDEAWSAKLAHEVGTPLGIFVKINHDNSHHLNSLWLQTVGPGAPSWLARLPAILTSSIAILVAAAIAQPRGRLAMLVTATLFAVSPILVTLGSEARGYAPMTLAFLTAVLLVDRWLARGAGYRPQRALALCFFLGIFSQMTMLFGIVALCGWVFFALLARDGFVPAVRGSLRLFMPALIAAAVAMAAIAAAAAADPGGFRFGSYDPFDFAMYRHGVDQMIGYTLGWPIVTDWWIPLAVGLVVLAGPAGAGRPAFYRLAIIGFPLALALLQSGNVAYPRYYLVAGVGLLLLLGEMIALGVERGGWRRHLAMAGGLLLLAGSLSQDIDLIRNQRGDAAQAIAQLRARAPGGATLMLDRSVAQAIVEIAAAQQRYPLQLQFAECPATRFVFADRFQGTKLPPTLLKCGVTYRPVATREARGLSGAHWGLYERLP